MSHEVVGATGRWGWKMKTSELLTAPHSAKRPFIILRIHCVILQILNAANCSEDISPLWNSSMGRDSSVGIATRYGLDGRGIESRWGRDFPHPSRPALEPNQPLYNGYRVSPRGKAAGAWRWPTTTSSAEVKERVELYLYSPYGPSWPFIGWTLPLPLPFMEFFWDVMWFL